MGIDAVKPAPPPSAPVAPHPSKKEKPHDPVPNLQRQQQQQDRTRHPVRHLRGPSDADAKQMEQEAMTPTQRAAMEQALEALELTDNDAVYGLYRDEKRQINVAIAALRAALAEQPAEQAPVATVTVNEAMGANFHFTRPHTLLPGQVLYVYTAPQPKPAEQMPIAMKTHGAWDGLELLDGLPDGTCLYTTPQPAIPPGYKLVPVEPTEEMLDAAFKYESQGSGIQGGDVIDAIRDAISAVPEAPQPAQRVPLTDARANALCSPFLKRILGSDRIFKEVALELVRTIEAAHGITGEPQ